MSTISPVSSDPPARRALDDLSPAELRALVASAAWYAKYHQGEIVDDARSTSARAVMRRRHFNDLYDALGKLGVRIRRPEALSDLAQVDGRAR